MNVVNAKEYLKQIDMLERKVNNKLAELYQLRQLASSISISTDSEKVMSSMKNDKIDNAVIKIIEKEDEIAECVEKLTETKEFIIKQIEGMEAKYYDMLFKRYVEKKTFEVIADEMMYSFRQITRIHGDALVAFDKKYLQSENVS